LFQYALARGNEALLMIVLEELLGELTKIKAFRFGEFLHEIVIKVVMDLAATWKYTQRKSFKVSSGSLDGIKFVIGDEFCPFQGCPVCFAGRSSTCQHNIKLNWFKSIGDEPCDECHNTYKNIGVVNFFNNIVSNKKKLNNIFFFASMNVDQMGFYVLGVF
jgi:hypothetical protein